MPEECQKHSTPQDGGATIIPFPLKLKSPRPPAYQSEEPEMAEIRAILRRAMDDTKIPRVDEIKRRIEQCFAADIADLHTFLVLANRRA